MKLVKTAFDGVLILEPVIHQDDRGYFFESWNQRVFEEAGLYYNWVQDNQSQSVYMAVRGIHYQKPPYAQAKLIQVLQGSILDAVIDLRAGSSTYGRHLAIELSAESHRQILIPQGFGHGYSVLSDMAVIAYKCDNYYTPDAEGIINAYDQNLAIDWGIGQHKAIRSEKDTKAQSFAEYSQSPDFIYEKKRGS